MKTLLLTLMVSGSFAFASNYDERAREYWERDNKAKEQLFLEKRLEGSRAFREKVYLFSYRFTNGSPELARQATCWAELSHCQSGACFSGSIDAKKVALDTLASNPFFVSSCDLNIPAPVDLACRMSSSWTKERGVFYYARCIDKNGVSRDFDNL